MKKIVFPFLGMLMLVFSGCMDKGGNSEYVSEIAGIVGVSDSFQPTIITAGYTYLAPELQSHLYVDLYEGDAIIAAFTIDHDNQPSTDYFTASGLQYMKVTKGSSYSTPEGESMTGDYTAPIGLMAPYSVVGNVMFFLFQHTAPSDQAFEYELTYPQELGEVDYPTIYLRAKTSGTGTKSETTVTYPYAFNMSYFFSTYKNSENIVKFRIKYKTGVDEEGNDVYKEWTDSSTGSNVLGIKVE